MSSTDDDKEEMCSVHSNATDTAAILGHLKFCTTCVQRILVRYPGKSDFSAGEWRGLLLTLMMDHQNGVI